MGLFGGGNSSSRTSYTTNTTDASLNMSDSKILESGSIESFGNVTQVDDNAIINEGQYTQLGAGAVLADEVIQKTDSDNLILNADAGVTATINQFSDNAAGVVEDALSAVKDITTKNLQLHSDRNLMANASGITAEKVQEFLSKPKTQATGALLGIGLFVLIYKKA